MYEEDIFGLWKNRKMVKKDCEETQEAGIENSLLNYFQFYGKGKCSINCPLGFLCPLRLTKENTEFLENVIEDMTKKGVIIRCPILLYDLED